MALWVNHENQRGMGGRHRQATYNYALWVNHETARGLDIARGGGRVTDRLHIQYIALWVNHEQQGRCRRGGGGCRHRQATDRLHNLSYGTLGQPRTPRKVSEGAGGGECRHRQATDRLHNLLYGTLGQPRTPRKVSGGGGDVDTDRLQTGYIIYYMALWVNHEQQGVLVGWGVGVEFGGGGGVDTDRLQTGYIIYYMALWVNHEQQGV